MQPTTLDRIAKHLADIGAVSLEDYLDGHCPAPQQAPYQHPASATDPADGNAISRLHQACQRTFRSTDALKFEFIDAGSKTKQCILTILRPDGAQRSYATQPVFAKKSEAKSEAAKIAIDMGALDFLTGQEGPARDLGPSSVETFALSEGTSLATIAPEMLIDDIEKCCLEWRAARVTPQWVPFFDPKLPQKQGCALRIQLSPHLARIYLSDPAFDTHTDAKGACAKAAVVEGVLDFIKHGNGQTRPSSPPPPTSSATRPLPVAPTKPWTLQAFYDSLPRPFPEPFPTNDASEINPLGWMNNMMQNARGGKLISSFFFTSDGPPGLHGCILKLDRPGEYKASLVDARFLKRSDAKAAACLQAMSEGIGDYIRTIVAALDNKVTSAMRSFSSSMVYPALTSGLSKIDSDLHPHFEYNKERDAFGATVVVRLSTLPTTEQVRRYTVPSNYRSKADAKVAVVCHAAEQGVVEFVCFRGEPPPNGYQPGSLEVVEQGQPAKKKKKRGKRRAETMFHGEVSLLEKHPSVRPSGDQIHGISGPGDIGLSQSVPMDGSCDPSQPGVGGGGGSGAARPAAYGHGLSYIAPMHATSYPATLDPRFATAGGSGTCGYGVDPLPGAYSDPSPTVDVLPFESGPSRAKPGSSLRALHPPAEDAELEPGEVVSSAESEFSVSSSRNEDGDVPANEREVDLDMNKEETETVSVGDVAANIDKGKGKETSPANTSTTTSRDGASSTSPVTSTANHVQNLIDYCARLHCGTPSFHELQNQGRFLVWIVIGMERFDLPTTYGTAEEGRQRVAKQVLARLSKGPSG